MVRRFILCVLILFAAPAWGAPRTVCGSGCDWTTIKAAESGATAGDVITVSGGPYKESNIVFTANLTWVASGAVVLQNSGAGEYAVAFAASSNARSMTGFTFDGEGAKNDAAYFSNGAHNVTLTSCTFQGGDTYLIDIGGTSDAITIQTSTFAGTAPVTAAIYANNPTNFVVDGNTFSHTSARAIYIAGDTGAISITDNVFNCALSNRAINVLGAGAITITGNTGTIVGNVTGPNSFVSITTASKTGAIEISDNTVTMGATALPPVGNTIAITAGAHAVTIDGNTLIHPGTAQTTSCIELKDQPAPVVNGNTCTHLSTQSGIVPIKIQSTGAAVGAAQVTNNTVNTVQTGAQAILIGTDTSNATALSGTANAAVTSNDTTLTDTRLAMTTDAQAGNVLTCNGKTMTVVSNTATVFTGAAWSDGGNPGNGNAWTMAGSDNKIDAAIITGNTVNSALAANNHGIEYGYNKNGVVKGNYAYGGKYGIVIKGNETYTAGYAAYNILKDQEDEGLRVKGVKNLPVYNNTFYLSSGRTITNGLLYITINADSGDAASTGTIAKNNIFFNQADQTNINCDAASATDMEIDYSIHYPFKAIVGATTYTVWADWTGAGFDTTYASTSDPMFRGATNADFMPLAASPAIDSGADVSLTTDYYGNAVPKRNGVDIGAVERQSFGGLFQNFNKTNRFAPFRRLH